MNFVFEVRHISLDMTLGLFAFNLFGFHKTMNRYFKWVEILKSL